MPGPVTFCLRALLAAFLLSLHSRRAAIFPSARFNERICGSVPGLRAELGPLQKFVTELALGCFVATWVQLRT